ncbi:MAG: pilin, partial [bacterium]|nr:pilin [bacterium]
MFKKIKNIFLVLVVFITLFGVFSPAFAEEEPKGPALELVYPIIPGETQKVPINSGLPAYINYIYQLAMALIGIIIFGVLIYNGVLWFTSAGNADKLKTAKEGITAAFLGAIILFSAFIVFRTINPQLTILKLTDPKSVEPVIVPGIYICNYFVPNIKELVNSYLYSNDKDVRVDAAKEIKAAMYNNKGGCFRTIGSGKLKD